MSKDDFWKDLVTAGSIIGGAWILSEILKSLSKEVYRCSCCNNIVNKDRETCPYCGAKLKW